jgi:hypothetical protein
MIKIYDMETGSFIDDEKLLMELAGLETYNRYEAIGVQDDGTPVVFDRCGNFGYLNPSVYRAVVVLEQT